MGGQQSVPDFEVATVFVVVRLAVGAVVGHVVVVVVVATRSSWFWRVNGLRKRHFRCSIGAVSATRHLRREGGKVYLFILHSLFPS